MPRPKLCRINEHTWRTKRTGIEQCEKCKTLFPCKGKDCGHLDCAERRLEMAAERKLS